MRDLLDALTKDWKNCEIEEKNAYLASVYAFFEKKSYYELFGIANATAPDNRKLLRSNYRKLLLLVHPDRNQNNLHCMNLFKLVYEGYQTLTDVDLERKHCFEYLGSLRYRERMENLYGVISFPWRKVKVNGHKVRSYIIKQNIESDDVVLLDEYVYGDMTIKIMGDVYGNIFADELTVYGNVYGSIHAMGSVTIYGNVEGKIYNIHGKNHIYGNLGNGGSVYSIHRDNKIYGEVQGGRLRTIHGKNILNGRILESQNTAIGDKSSYRPKPKLLTAAAETSSRSKSFSFTFFSTLKKVFLTQEPSIMRRLQGPQ